MGLKVKSLASLIILMTVYSFGSLQPCFAMSRHQKTSPCLPEGAPLPDVEVPENDSISAREAYEKALASMQKRYDAEAPWYFERAIYSLRRAKQLPSHELVEKIVLDYCSLMRAHFDPERAEALYEEFLGVDSGKRNHLNSRFLIHTVSSQD